MEELTCCETMSFLECGEGLRTAEGGVGAGSGTDGVALILSLRACETCWPDWMSGSGTLPASRLCDTVVMLARKGSRAAVDKAEGVSSNDRRIVRAKRAIVVWRWGNGVSLLSLSPSAISFSWMVCSVRWGAGIMID